MRYYLFFLFLLITNGKLLFASLAGMVAF